MDAIPAKLRKALYLTLSLAGIVVGALNVADVNTGKAVDVIAYLGTALGLVAAGNVATKAPLPLADLNASLAHINESLRAMGPKMSQATAAALNKAAKKAGEDR